MTVIAGFVGLRPDFSVPEEACQEIRTAISRHPGEWVQEERGPRHYLAKFDIGAFGAPGLHADESGAISLLAGEPLLDAAGRGRKRPRSEDLLEIHRRWLRNDRSILRAARGAFCLAQFDPATHRLDLVADKLGLRSLYYHLSDEYVVFASVLRVLESSRFVPRRMDVRGVAEMATMRVALADRTPYADVKLLKAGQILSLSDERRASDTYWRWDTIPPASATSQELRREAYRRFAEAVRLRMADDRATIALLSGGLDSRCIVTALKDAGATLYTYSVAFPGTLDEPLAEAYAQAIGSNHRHVSVTLDQGFSPLNNVLPLLDAGDFDQGARPERPRVIWSGEGGSGVIGCVGQTAEVVALLRQGRISAAAERFLAGKRQRLPRKLFARSVADLISDLPRRGLAERLRSFECADPGSAIRLFDLVDYQSRHLNDHYESIDLTRVELETPFYDGDFVALMYSVAVDACLYHDFYHAWLAEFPAVIMSVPWQTYPGHRPCPLPLPDGVRDQWAKSHESEWQRKWARQQLKSLDRVLSGTAFPDPLLDRPALALVRWSTRLGFGGYGYVLERAGLFSKYWRACGGRFVMPQQGPVSAGRRAVQEVARP